MSSETCDEDLGYCMLVQCNEKQGTNKLKLVIRILDIMKLLQMQSYLQGFMTEMEKLALDVDYISSCKHVLITYYIDSVICE